MKFFSSNLISNLYFSPQIENVNRQKKKRISAISGEKKFSDRVQISPWASNFDIGQKSLENVA